MVFDQAWKRVSNAEFDREKGTVGKKRQKHRATHVSPELYMCSNRRSAKLPSNVLRNASAIYLRYIAGSICLQQRISDLVRLVMQDEAAREGEQNMVPIYNAQITNADGFIQVFD